MQVWKLYLSSNLKHDLWQVREDLAFLKFKHILFAFGEQKKLIINTHCNNVVVEKYMSTAHLI